MAPISKSDVGTGYTSIEAMVADPGNTMPMKNRLKFFRRKLKVLRKQAHYLSSQQTSGNETRGHLQHHGRRPARFQTAPASRVSRRGGGSVATAAACPGRPRPARFRSAASCQSWPSATIDYAWFNVIYAKSTSIPSHEVR